MRLQAKDEDQGLDAIVVTKITKQYLANNRSAVPVVLVDVRRPIYGRTLSERKLSINERRKKGPRQLGTTMGLYCPGF